MHFILRKRLPVGNADSQNCAFLLGKDQFQWYFHPSGWNLGKFQDSPRPFQLWGALGRGPFHPDKLNFPFPIGDVWFCSLLQFKALLGPVWFLLDWLTSEVLVCVFWGGHLPRHRCGFACHSGEICGVWRFVHFLGVADSWLCLPKSKVVFSRKVILTMAAASPALSSAMERCGCPAASWPGSAGSLKLQAVWHCHPYQIWTGIQRQTGLRIVES